MEPGPHMSWWTRFWHAPVRAERLALMRILLAVALLADQLIQLLPHLADFYGDSGVAPEGLYDRYQLRNWRIAILFFNSGDLTTIRIVFGIWVAVTFLFLIGYHTKLMNIAVWFLNLCFNHRNPLILNGGDDALQVGLLLLMLGPCGRALSVDAWLRRRAGNPYPATLEPWLVRVLQIQLSLIYFSTGLVKLAGDPFLEGTWWDGTSVHYVLNYVTMSRWSYAQLQFPYWITAILSYSSVWWEALFPLLVLCRWTRTPTLIFGIGFHLGIYFTIEVGWFSFYMFPFYAVWVSDRFWAQSRAAEPDVRSATERAAAETLVGASAGRIRC